MLDRSLNTQRCPECGTRLPWDTTMCPTCGQALLGRLSEHCPECGARMAPGAGQCPICGAQRLGGGSRGVLGRWARPAGAVALVAFILAVLLIRPWERVTPADLPRPNIALLPTATFTPTRRPTQERPPTAATRAVQTEGAAAAITIPPTRTPTPTPITPTPTRPATYVVVEGDTPSGIATRFGVATTDLMAANGLRINAILSIGQRLVIPTPTGEDADEQTPAPTGTPAPPATPVPTYTPTPTPTFTATPTATSTPAPRNEAMLASPHAAATRRAEAFTYVVESGDTLSEIANANGLTAAELAEANGLRVNAILSVGQELVIPVPPEEATALAGIPHTPTPAPQIHVVQSGENLGLIAAQYDVGIAEIAAANGIRANSILSIGQELVIPGRYAELSVATPTLVATAAHTPEPVATGIAVATPGTPTTPPPAPPGATATPGTPPPPTPVIHVVARGDTLGSIAVTYGVSSERIATANGIRITSLLRIGQELVIPDTSLVPTSEPPLAVTPTPTPTPTPTVSPTPTATRVPGFIYSQPRLLAPVDGSTFQGKEANILMNWTSVGILPEDEWYVVRVWRSEKDTQPVTSWTKATSWRMPQDLYPTEGGSNDFLWQVNVMRRPLGAQTGVAISPSSEIYQFNWR